jgi:hypothetical protein
LAIAQIGRAAMITTDIPIEQRLGEVVQGPASIIDRPNPARATFVRQVLKPQAADRRPRLLRPADHQDRYLD